MMFYLSLIRIYLQFFLKEICHFFYFHHFNIYFDEHHLQIIVKSDLDQILKNIIAIIDYELLLENKKKCSFTLPINEENTISIENTGYNEFSR